jgi:hypothetical protein
MDDEVWPLTRKPAAIQFDEILRLSPWLTDKSRDVFIHESASVKMPPQHNEINAFSEEDAHGEHVFPL